MAGGGGGGGGVAFGWGGIGNQGRRERASVTTTPFRCCSAIGPRCTNSDVSHPTMETEPYRTRFPLVVRVHAPAHSSSSWAVGSVGTPRLRSCQNTCRQHRMPQQRQQSSFGCGGHRRSQVDGQRTTMPLFLCWFDVLWF
jgi:hypothetical protein